MSPDQPLSQGFQIVSFIVKYITLYYIKNQSNPLRDLSELCLTSHQQPRSYGDGATAKSLIRQTGEAGNRTCGPWFIRRVVI